MKPDDYSIPSPPTRQDRLLAAIAHLGLPLGGPILPLVLRSIRTDIAPFVRRHATIALVYQLLLIPLQAASWLYLAIAGEDGPFLSVVAVGFLLQLPFIAMALSGKLRPSQSRDKATG
ncbi:MAG: DUF4870 domain-containing protein [Acidimicrobiia bacterium]|nr:DUF4870 domain-containing protein [Acidimicrobiia bacterium]